MSNQRTFFSYSATDSMTGETVQGDFQMDGNVKSAALVAEGFRQRQLDYYRNTSAAHLTPAELESFERQYVVAQAYRHGHVYAVTVENGENDITVALVYKMKVTDDFDDGEPSY